MARRLLATARMIALARAWQLPSRRAPGLAGVLLAIGLLASAPAAAKGQHRAAIDIGSSSIKLLVVNQRGRVVLDEKLGVGLGRGIGEDRLLPAANRQRAVRALAELVAHAGRFGIAPGEIETIATAAVRNADGRLTGSTRRAGKTTGRTFLKKGVRGRLGLTRARIVSGKEEARLGHRGALAGLTEPLPARFVVIDVGGGSHQLVVASGATIEAMGSAQVGANLVAERVLGRGAGDGHEVATADDLAAADRRMARVVRRLPVPRSRAAGAVPVLIGGNARVLRLQLGKDVVTRSEVDELRHELAALPLAQRRARLLRDASGRPLSARAREQLGLHRPDARGTKLPAKLTLLLRLFDLLGSEEIRLAETDARHALLVSPAGS